MNGCQKKVKNGQPTTLQAQTLQFSVPKIWGNRKYLQTKLPFPGHLLSHRSLLKLLSPIKRLPISGKIGNSLLLCLH